MRKLLYIALLALVIPSSDKITDLYLPNGLKLILKEDDTVSSIGLSVFYNVGSHDDPDGQKGMTGLQRFIMQESGEYNKINYSDRNMRLEEITDESKYRHTSDLMYFSHEFSPRWFDEIVDIESQRLSIIDITDNSLERAKRAMIADGDEIYSDERTKHNSYPEGHPYKFHRWGDTLHIKSISVDDAIDFRKRYINPNSATIVVTGNFSSKDVVQSIYAKFGDIKNNGRVQLDPDFSITDTVVPHRKFGDDKAINRNLVEAGMFIHVTAGYISVPSSRQDDIQTIKHIANLIRYDSALEMRYAKKYMNRNGTLTMSFVDQRLGPSKFEIITINFAKKKRYKKILKNYSRMFKDIAEYGFDEESINIYRKRELLRLYTKRSKRLESVNLGYSEIINGDYTKYNREIERLESLDNEEIKRVAAKYLAGQHIHSTEVMAGSRNFLTPLFSFFWNGIFIRSSEIRIAMKKSNLASGDDI